MTIITPSANVNCCQDIQLLILCDSGTTVIVGYHVMGNQLVQSGVWLPDGTVYQPTGSLSACTDGGGGGNDPNVIADAIVSAFRNVSAATIKFSGVGPHTLPVPPNSIGRIVSASDAGTGQGYLTIDGTVPSTTNGYEVNAIGAHLQDLISVPLSQVQIVGSAGGSQINIAYEVYN